MEMISQFSNIIAGGACEAPNGTKKRVIKCRGLVREVEVEETYDKRKVERRIENVRKEADTIAVEKTSSFGNITVSSSNKSGNKVTALALWGGICSLNPITISLSLPKSEPVLECIRGSRSCIIHDSSRGTDIKLRVLKSFGIGDYVTLISEVVQTPEDKDTLTYLASDMFGNIKFLNKMKAQPYMYKNE